MQVAYVGRGVLLTLHILMDIIILVSRYLQDPRRAGLMQSHKHGMHQMRRATLQLYLSGSVTKAAESRLDAHNPHRFATSHTHHTELQKSHNVTMYSYLFARTQLARYTYLGDPLVVVADKDSAWAGPAVAALVRGMAKEDMVAGACPDLAPITGVRGCVACASALLLRIHQAEGGSMQAHHCKLSHTLVTFTLYYLTNLGQGL